MIILDYRTRDGKVVEELERQNIHERLRDVIPQVGDVICTGLWGSESTVYQVLSKVFDYGLGVVHIYVEPKVITFSDDKVMPS